MSSATQPAAPAPVGPAPSPRQLAWEKRPFYLFAHFGINTFTGREWGHGHEDPNLFHPTELDCRQWCALAKDIGAHGIILTAKHHDGFCLWPSRYSRHTVKSSSWRSGKGDVVGDLAAACKEAGLQLGIYLSPWDRTEASYGTGKEYNDFFCNQLRELLTTYAAPGIFEVWFDGACGEGANGKKQQYDWPRIWSVVRELAPSAVMFSDIGPDVRWVGNERGFAADPNWAMFPDDPTLRPGTPIPFQTPGKKDGDLWLPTEADVSVRPGWFYHASEDDRVHSLPHLLDIYLHSVGLNGSLLLNLPIDRRGLVHENDCRRLRELKRVIDMAFAADYATGATMQASVSRGAAFNAPSVIDGNETTYWAAPDGVMAATLEADLRGVHEINLVHLEEYTPLGQRIDGFAIDCRVGGTWREVATGTTVGLRRFVRFAPVTTDAIRVRIRDAKACPTLRKLGAYRMPELVPQPRIERNDHGLVTISAPAGRTVRYTVDGSVPGSSSPVYGKPFEVKTAATVRAAVEPLPGETVFGEENRAAATFEILRHNWHVTSVSSEAPGRESAHALSGDSRSYWRSADSKHPHWIEIDMGETLPLRGFTYTPASSGHDPEGVVYDYAFYVSADGSSWGEPVSAGAFQNIANNPVRQEIFFAATTNARHVRFESRSAVRESPCAAAVSLGVLV